MPYEAVAARHRPSRYLTGTDTAVSEWRGDNGLAVAGSSDRKTPVHLVSIHGTPAYLNLFFRFPNERGDAEKGSNTLVQNG